MKYTTKIEEACLAGGVKIDPNGGNVTDAQAKAIASDPWGKKMIAEGKLVFEKTVEIPTKPKLGMTVNSIPGSETVKGTNTEKTAAKK